MVSFSVGCEPKQRLVVLCRATVHETHVCPRVQARNCVLTLVHHHAMGHRIGELQQPWMLYHLALDMPDQIGGQEKVLQAQRTALRDDVQHIAVVDLSDNPLHFDDDGAGNEVFSPEMDACTMPGPPTGNEPTERERTADRRENEASVIAGDLQTEEVHGSLSLRPVQRPLV